MYKHRPVQPAVTTTVPPTSDHPCSEECILCDQEETPTKLEEHRRQQGLQETLSAIRRLQERLQYYGARRETFIYQCLNKGVLSSEAIVNAYMAFRNEWNSAPYPSRWAGFSQAVGCSPYEYSTVFYPLDGPKMAEVLDFYKAFHKHIQRYAWPTEAGPG